MDLDPDFGRALGARIKAAKISLGAFARRCGHSPGILTLVISGRRKPPAKHLKAWADALELHGDERLRFIEDGHLAGATSPVRRLVEQLREQVAARR